MQSNELRTVHDALANTPVAERLGALVSSVIDHPKVKGDAVAPIKALISVATVMARMLNTAQAEAVAQHMRAEADALETKLQ